MVIDRLLAQLQAPTLDRRLADGTAGRNDWLSTVRADVLQEPATRLTLADGWAAVLQRADDPRRLMDPRVPVMRSRVRAAEADIRAMIDVLRDSLPVPARGVAIANRLLTDGTGPLYSARNGEYLRAAVRSAIHYLTACSTDR
jgi:hypothetical protein